MAGFDLFNPANSFVAGRVRLLRGARQSVRRPPHDGQNAVIAWLDRPIL
jgi:hypothetical protein